MHRSSIMKIDIRRTTSVNSTVRYIFELKCSINRNSNVSVCHEYDIIDFSEIEAIAELTHKCNKTASYPND